MEYSVNSPLNHSGNSYSTFFLQRHFLLSWLAVITFYRIYCLTQEHMSVFIDEAYYYYWAQNLQWGYYSKPPVVAWLIAFSTLIFGVSEYALKIFSPCLYSASAWLVYLIGNKLADGKTGVVAALLFSSAPIVGFNSVFITTDAPLFFFWSLSSYLFLCCLATDQLKWWGCLGFSVGLGMLSKYTFVLLPCGFLLYIILIKRMSVLLTLNFLFALICSITIFSFNIYWNIQHNFISLTHTKEIAKLDGPLFNLAELGTFLATQIAIFGVVWVMLLIKNFPMLLSQIKADLNFGNNILERARSSRTDVNSTALLFLVCTLLPILLVISAQAFLSRAYANWAGPFVIQASVVVALVINRYTLRKSLLVFGMAFNLVLVSLFYHWPIVLRMFDISPSKINSPYYRVAGWEQLADKVQRVLNQYPNTKLVGSSRALLAYIGFYAKVDQRDILYWNPNRSRIENHYDLVANIADMDLPLEQEYIFLNESPLDMSIISAFSSTQFLDDIKIQSSHGVTREVFLYHFAGFTNYASQ